MLVTSALHMWCALATFRAARIGAIPAPTDFEVRPRQVNLFSFLQDAKALVLSTEALHEYAGMFLYWLRGWASFGPGSDAARGAAS